MSDDWIQLQSDPIDVVAATAFVSVPESGGTAIFLGTTRAETSVDGQPLLALDYEAYEDMAHKQMHDVGRRARERWPIHRLAILHRIGRVALARPSVLIAVACPHRGEAFDACRWIIDTLKAEVPIWKKELWQGGRQRWVHPAT